MKLELAILAGPESKKFLADFTTQIDRLEKLQSAGQVSKKAAASDDEEEEEVVAPKKAAKAKKLTSDDVNNQAKAYATALIKRGKTGPEARKAVVAILKKKFEVSSVTELESDQYAAVIKALAI